MFNKKGGIQQIWGRLIILIIMFLVAVSIFFVYKLITETMSFT